MKCEIILILLSSFLFYLASTFATQTTPIVVGKVIARCDSQACTHGENCTDERMLMPIKTARGWNV